MKGIYEYEFEGRKHGKKLTVQQSAFDAVDARKRIKSKDKDVVLGKVKRKLHYPHSEGGKRI